jgi:spermidine/putrescine transport system ATP-binding protein
MSLLEMRHITRRFDDDTVAVDDLSLSIQPGEFFTLLGPSGCGKTTLLRMIAGFDDPDAGSLLLDGEELAGVPPEQRPVHTVFQSYALFPHMSVAENVAFPLRMASVRRAEREQRTREALEQVRLADFAHRRPDQLSGGQRQRVAVARALVNRPRLLLLDEPLAALDLKMREQMQIELISLQMEVGITFVYVTHDQGEALALSDRLAVMNNGRVEQVGDPSDVYEFPDTRFVADFIGTCNLLDGSVGQSETGLVYLDVPGLGPLGVASDASPRTGAPGTLAVRPEKVRIDARIEPATHENRLEGTVHDQLYLGDVTVYRIEITDGQLVEAMLPNTSARGERFFDFGDQVQLAWRHDAGRLLAD